MARHVKIFGSRLSKQAYLEAKVTLNNDKKEWGQWVALHIERNPKWQHLLRILPIFSFDMMTLKIA